MSLLMMMMKLLIRRDRCVCRSAACLCNLWCSALSLSHCSIQLVNIIIFTVVDISLVLHKYAAHCTRCSKGHICTAYGAYFLLCFVEITIFPLPNTSRGEGSLPIITNVTPTTTLQNTNNHHMVTLWTSLIWRRLSSTCWSHSWTGVLHLAKITWGKSVL